MPFWIVFFDHTLSVITVLLLLYLFTSGVSAIIFTFVSYREPVIKVVDRQMQELLSVTGNLLLSSAFLRQTRVI